MNLAEVLSSFYRNLKPPELQEDRVEVLFPYSDAACIEVIENFLVKYYSEEHSRISLWGINPGRHGTGITGIPFTDPWHLQNACSIPHTFSDRKEISSEYIYRMIEKLGSIEWFYNHFYLSSVCPVGFIREGKNFNYYDTRTFRQRIETYISIAVGRQLKHGIRRDIAFSIGVGKNYIALTELNEKYKWFEKIESIPHPRWVMQYQRKNMHEWIEKSCVLLRNYVD